MMNEEAKAFLDNLKICINEHPVVADWLVEIANRKTENDSEKPNNCETCRFELYCPEMCEGCCEWDSHYEPKTEPTISKMEQVDKDINVRSKEPQTDCGDFANRLAYERGVKHAWEVAQKVFDSTVTFYEAEDVAKQITKGEPQTENPCDGCVCDDGKHLMYCMNCKGIAWKTEPPKIEDEPQKWETPPKFEHKGVTTTCVNVMASKLEYEVKHPSCETCRYDEPNNPKCDECIVGEDKPSNYEPQTDCPWK